MTSACVGMITLGDLATDRAPWRRRCAATDLGAVGAGPAPAARRARATAMRPGRPTAMAAAVLVSSRHWPWTRTISGGSCTSTYRQNGRTWQLVQHHQAACLTLARPALSARPPAVELELIGSNDAKSERRRRRGTDTSTRTPPEKKHWRPKLWVPAGGL